MVEFSKAFRTGRLTQQNARCKLAVEGGTVPFISLKMESEFSIGLGETYAEETNVLLIGDAVTELWTTMTPKPQIGDTVRLNYATLYVKNGVACCRVFDPSQVEVVPQERAAAAASLESYQTVEARDFFRMVMKEREREKNK